MSSVPASLSHYFILIWGFFFYYFRIAAAFPFFRLFVWWSERFRQKLFVVPTVSIFLSSCTSAATGESEVVVATGSQ